MRLWWIFKAADVAQLFPHASHSKQFLFLFAPLARAAAASVSSSFRIILSRRSSSSFVVAGIFTHNTNFSSSSSSLLSLLLLLTTTTVFALNALCGFELFRRLISSFCDCDCDCDARVRLRVRRARVRSLSVRFWGKSTERETHKKRARYIYT